MLRVPIHRIESSCSKYHKVVEMFHVWQKKCEGTYQCLRQYLDEYSVFAERSPLVSHQQCITRYGSTLYIGIAMVFVFSPHIRKFSSYFHFRAFNDFIV